MSNDLSGIDDLLPGLESPLWEGADEDFTAYARATFGIPATMRHISITPRGPAGRSAVAIDDAHGGLIFALTPDPDKQQTHIRSILAGPRFVNDRVVLTRARAFDVGDVTLALTSLALRHLPVEVVKDLLTTED